MAVLGLALAETGADNVVADWDIAVAIGEARSPTSRLEVLARRACYYWRRFHFLRVLSMSFRNSSSNDAGSSASRLCVSNHSIC